MLSSRNRMRFSQPTNTQTSRFCEIEHFERIGNVKAAIERYDLEIVQDALRCNQIPPKSGATCTERDPIFAKNAKITKNVIKINNKIIKMCFFNYFQPPITRFPSVDPARKTVFSSIPENRFLGRFLGASTLNMPLK